MKLGISYNLFDGEELLESSLKSVREEADYINVIYQTISYFGNSASANLEEQLLALQSKGLIDEIYHYQADFSTSADKHIFEVDKRNIGLKLAKKHGMTHFLSMDVDEFYDNNQLHRVKKFIESRDIACSACSIVEYLKSPQYQIVNGYTFPPNQENYNFYVPFIMKIAKWLPQKHSHYFPTLVDPTRALNNSKKFYLFPVQDIVMHHMSTIRKNLAVKYQNSNLNSTSLELNNEIKILQKDILKWQFKENRITENLALFRNKIIKKVPNRFNIPNFQQDE